MTYTYTGLPVSFKDKKFFLKEELKLKKFISLSVTH